MIWLLDSLAITIIYTPSFSTFGTSFNWSSWYFGGILLQHPKPQHVINEMFLHFKSSLWNISYKIEHNKDATSPNKAFCFLLTPLPNLHVTKENQKLNDKPSLSFDMFKQGCILSLELRLTHNWRPCCNPIFVGILECTIPCPVVIHYSKRQMLDWFILTNIKWLKTL